MGLYLLTVGFKRDVNDAERVGIHESLFTFYYSKYYKKAINCKWYGKDSLEELCKLAKDVVEVNSDTRCLMRTLAEGAADAAADFVKLQEEDRRQRQRRIDAGDESVRLKFDMLKKERDNKEK